MKVVITDAYSPTNIGDGELVRLSINSVRSRFTVDPVVLCTDKDGFESSSGFAGAKFVYKPLSRVLWRRRRGMSRFVLLLRDASAIVIGLMVSSSPIDRRTKKSLLGRTAVLLNVPWLKEVSEADVVVGVGGGYLGDKYLRESLMTLAIFRIAFRIGAKVETMPVSISSASDSRLRFALRAFGQGVAWRSREKTTHNILVSMGLDSHCVPDLAWLNASTHYEEPKKFSLVLAPLGSDFYDQGVGTEPKIWRHVKAHIEGLRAGDRIGLIAMHYWDGLLQDGRDDEECKRLQHWILEHNPQVDVEILTMQSYPEVLQTMAAAEIAVCERLHAALAGLATGTPTKVVGYEPKHRGVLELAGLDALIDESFGFVLENVRREFILDRGAVQSRSTREAVMGA